MTRRFVLTLEAKADLRAILLDIAEDNPDTAERIGSEFSSELQKLASDIITMSFSAESIVSGTLQLRYCLHLGVQADSRDQHSSWSA